MRGGGGGGSFRRGSVESRQRWGGPDVAHVGYPRLLGYILSGWCQAAASRGVMVVEASLLPNNCIISSEQSLAEFGDGRRMTSRQWARMLQHPG